MKTFEKFQKSSTVYKIDEAQGFSSFVGKAMGFARKVKNIATTGSLNKPADSIKQIAAKAANRAKSAPNSPLNPNPMKGKLGASLRNNPQAKAKAIEARSVANNPSKPKQNTDSAPTSNPSSRPTSSALATRPESKGVRQNPAVAKTKEFIKKKAPVVKQKVGDFVRKQVKNVASKSAYRTDDKGKDLDDKIEKTGKKDKQGRAEFKTRGRPTIGGIRAALQSKGARELGSKLNTVRKNLPTADDYRTGNEGSGFGFGGRFKGRSLKMVGDALGKDGKKFEKTKVVDRKGVGKGKSKKVIVRGRELDAEGNPIEKKKDTSFKGQAKDALRRAAGITDKKKVDKVEDKPKDEKVTTPGSNKVVGKPPSGDGGSKAPVPAKPKKPDGEGGAEAPIPKSDPAQERETDRPQADQDDRLDPKTGRRITKKFPDKVKPPRKPQPYSKTLGTKKPPKETPKLPAAKVPTEKETPKETPKEKEKGGELATVKGGDITKIKTPASKSKAPEKEKAIVPSSEKPKSQDSRIEKINNLINNPSATEGEKAAGRNALKRIRKREEAKNKVLSNNNVKTKTETKTEPKKEETPKTEPKKEETPKKEPVRAKRRSVRSKEFKNEDGTFNQKAYDDAKGRVETKKGGGRPKKQKEAEPSERKSSPSLTGKAFDRKELLKTSKQKKEADKEAEKRTKAAKDSGAIDSFSNKPIKDVQDTSKLVRDPKTGEQIANPTSSSKKSKTNTLVTDMSDDEVNTKGKQLKRIRDSRYNKTPAADDGAKRTKKYSNNPKTQAAWEKIEKRTPEEEEAAQQKMFGNKGAERATRKEIDKLRKRDMVNKKKKEDPKSNYNMKKKREEEEAKKNRKEEEAVKESYSNWREEFLWEVDKKYPDKVKEIKPMSGKNTITINPEDQTAKYKRGY